MNRHHSKIFIFILISLFIFGGSSNSVLSKENDTNEILDCTGFGMEKNIKTEPMFYLDFENYTNGIDSYSGFELQSRTQHVFPKYEDEEYGTQYAITSGNAIKVLDEPITSGKYMFSFDVKQTKPNGIIYVRATLNEPKSEARENMWETWTCSNGKMGYYSNSIGWNIQNSINIEPDSWYHIMMWMDFDNGIVYHYRDNEFIGSTSMPKVATSFWFCCDGRAYDNVTSVDNFSLYKVDYNLIQELVALGISIPEGEKDAINCTIESDVIANVFRNFEDVKLNIALNSKVTEEKNIKVLYHVEDHKGDKIWKHEESKFIEAGGNIQYCVIPPVSKYDRYVLYVKCIDETTGEILCNADRKFWVVSTPSDGYRSDRYGTCIHVSKGTNYTDWNKARYLIDISGLGFLRDDLPWSNYEGRENVYGFTGNAKNLVVPMFRESAQMNMKNLGIIYPYNTAYNMDYYDRIPRSQELLEKLEKAAEAMAAEYRGVMDYFEFGNEFDFERQDSMSCKEYATALQYFYRGIKKGNPDAMVVACCTTRTDPDWIGKVMLEGGKGYCDAVSIHSYHGTDTPESRDWIKSCGAVRAKLDELGMSDVELWTTEGNGQTDTQVFTEPMQATSLVRLLALCDAYNVCDKFIFYVFQHDGNIEGEYTNDFGVIYPSSTKNGYGPKLAYMAMTNFFARTENAKIDSIIQEGNEYIYRYKKTDGSYMLMLYSDGETKKVSLDVGATTGILYDMYGNPQELNSNDGKYTFVLTNEPSYFKYSGDSFEKCEDKFDIDNVFKELVAGSSSETQITVPDGAEIKVESRDNFTVDVNLENGIAKIKYTLNSIPDSFYYWQRTQDYGTYENRDSINISVMENGKQTGYFPLWIEYLDHQVDISMFVEPYDDTNTKYAVGKITISNLNGAKAVEGTIKMDYDETKHIVVDSIKPGESKTYKVNLPTTYTDGSHKLISGKFEISDGTIQSFSLGDTPRSYGYKENTGTSVRYLKKAGANKPIIDGVLNEEEWGNYKIVDFDKSQVTYGSQGIVIVGIKEKETFDESDDYGGKADFSGTIYSSWDEDFLYVASVIYDDVHYQKEGPVRYYLDDCFYVTANATTTQRHDTRIDLGLSEFWGDNKSRLYVNWSPLLGECSGGYVIPEGEDIAQSAAIRKDNKTIYEARIPWRYIIDKEALKNKNFNLYFAARDYDTDRDKTFNYGGWYCLID